jgi:predicted NUDIX family NTP pyrophosphohydrolase
MVHAWAVEGDCDADAIRSNTFEMEYPPRSGRWQTFPEADRAGWFTLPQAREKILPSQRPLLDQLEQMLSP